MLEELKIQIADNGVVIYNNAMLPESERKRRCIQLTDPDLLGPILKNQFQVLVDEAVQRVINVFKQRQEDENF